MNHQRDKGNPATENRETTDDKKSSTRKTTPIVQTPQPMATEPQTENPKWNKEERTYYRRYLHTQKAIVFITLGAIAVALCTLRSLNESVTAANKQASAAATQAQVARDQFAATQRAWLGIDSVEVVRTFEGKIAPKDVQFQTALVVKNFGGSLATNISMNWNLAGDTKELAAMAGTVCWERLPLPPPPVRHVTIFPNKTTPYMFGSILPAERIKALDKAPMPFLLGCFTYGDPFTKCSKGISDCHWTRFCYRERYDPSTKAKIVYDLWNDYNDAH